MSNNFNKKRDRRQSDRDERKTKIDIENPDIETVDDLGEAVKENLGREGEDPEGAAVEETVIDTQLQQIADLNAQVEKLQADVEKEKKEYLFLMAEFDNFRKRTVKEKSEIIRNAAESAMKGLLPIIDDFERGIEANKTATAPETIRQGMTLIYNKLVKYLEQNGVKPIESTGKDFDPDVHEAIAMVAAPDESLKGKVIDTPTKGYTIHDKVLRHAKVAVGQ